jgi:oxygen-independent coproporphyrinogen-3 oxidase
MSGGELQRTPVLREAALEENFFLGLRLTRGVSLRKLAAKFGDEAVGRTNAVIKELIECQLMARDGDVIRLTPRGRLLSNEVFENFILADTAV